MKIYNQIYCTCDIVLLGVGSYICFTKQPISFREKKESTSQNGTNFEFQRVKW